jgi:hypothetical protein
MLIQVLAGISKQPHLPLIIATSLPSLVITNEESE